MPGHCGDPPPRQDQIADLATQQDHWHPPPAAFTPHPTRVSAGRAVFGFLAKFGKLLTGKADFCQSAGSIRDSSGTVERQKFIWLVHNLNTLMVFDGSLGQ